MSGIKTYDFGITRGAELVPIEHKLGNWCKVEDHQAEMKKALELLQDMATVARNCGWQESTTGRQVMLGHVEKFLIDHGIPVPAELQPQNIG